METPRVILCNKPFGMLCQFTDDLGRPTLADLVKDRAVYPAGRLDFDSEGLVVLTNDKVLIHQLTDPRYQKLKCYWAQVEGEPDAAQMRQLAEGVLLNDGPTLPATIERLSAEPRGLWPRDPPIRFRKNKPTSWLQIGLREGRNRQVRRMTAHVGLPCLRLVRVSSGPFALGELKPGQVKTIGTIS